MIEGSPARAGQCAAPDTACGEPSPLASPAIAAGVVSAGSINVTSVSGMGAILNVTSLNTASVP
ncbi:MAG: hypothetical protein ACTSP2_08980 [Alphaproteobacteria bacterium]